MSKRHPLYCSFCGKQDHEVTKMICGPTVFICNECIDLCWSICRDAGVPFSGAVNVIAGEMPSGEVSVSSAAQVMTNPIL